MFYLLIFYHICCNINIQVVKISFLLYINYLYNRLSFIYIKNKKQNIKLKRREIFMEENKVLNFEEEIKKAEKRNTKINFIMVIICTIFAEFYAFSSLPFNKSIILGIICTLFMVITYVVSFKMKKTNGDIKAILVPFVFALART